MSLGKRLKGGGGPGLYPREAEELRGTEQAPDPASAGRENQSCSTCWGKEGRAAGREENWRLRQQTARCEGSGQGQKRSQITQGSCVLQSGATEASRAGERRSQWGVEPRKTAGRGAGLFQERSQSKLHRACFPGYSHGQAELEGWGLS